MRRTAIGLLSLLFGCGPDRIGLGVNLRQGKASYGPFSVDGNFPTVRVQAEKDFRDDFALYGKIEGIHGDIGTSQYLVEGDFRSRFGSIGTGVRYFPFSKNLSFDLGGELFYAEIDAQEKLAFIRNADNYDVFGWGLNAGVTGEVPLNERTRFFISGGYNFTDNWGDTCKFDFDGFYVFIGLNFDIPNRTE